MLMLKIKWLLHNQSVCQQTENEMRKENKNNNNVAVSTHEREGGKEASDWLSYLHFILGP